MENNHPNMSEQELINDALTTEKQLLHAYSTFLAEATCPNLRTELSKIIDETQKVQFQLFDAMQKKGWYQVKNAKLQEVQQTAQKYQQMKNQLQ